MVMRYDLDVWRVMVVGIMLALGSARGPEALAEAVTTTKPSSDAAFTHEELGQIKLLEAQSRVFRMVARKVGPAVVYVRTTTVEDPKQSPSVKELPEAFRKYLENDPRFRNLRPRPKNSMGSGVIIDADQGLILTNNHVVENAEAIWVRLADKRRFKAQVVSTDPPTELAVIQIKADNLHAITIGDSDQVEVGDWVIAVGNPFGLAQTFTRGMVSAKGRRRLNIAHYEDFIQTDAAINPGSSGGPLVNLRGEMIGLNSAIATTRQVPGNVGIGFSIPSKIILEVLPVLKTGQKVVRGYLGVEIQDLREQPGLAQTFGLIEDRGAVVTAVEEGTPAEKAGLKVDDIILEVNGEPIADAVGLTYRIAKVAPETTIALKIWRDNDYETVKVTVAEYPDSALALKGGTGRRNAEEEYAKAEDLGLAVRTLTPALAEEHGWDKDDPGVIVVEVDPLGEGAAIGIQVGDLIQTVQNQGVKTAKQFRGAMRKHPVKDGLRLYIKTHAGGHYVYLKTQ